MKKGTVIYIGGFELPDKNAAAHRVLNNGKLLRKIGYSAVFVDVCKSECNQDILNSKRNIQGFDVWSVNYPKSTWQWMKYIINIKEFMLVASKYNNIDMVVCYNYPAIALFNIMKYCKKNNIKVVADCTEWYVPQSGNFIFRIVKSFDSFLRMRIVHPKLDGIISISKYLYNYYKEKKPCIQLPPLVDKTEAKWQAVDRETDIDKVVLTYAGTPGDSKDKVDYIINILAEILPQLNKAIILNIIGITREQYDETFKVDKLSENLENTVVFHGRVSHTEAVNMVKKSSYSIFFRDNSLVNTAGFPTKFVESISCGTPVITNLTSNIGDFLVDGVNGYIVDINTKESCMKDLVRIINNSDLQNMYMNEQCRNFKHFDYCNYKSEMITFLDRI